MAQATGKGIGTHSWHHKYSIWIKTVDYIESAVEIAYVEKPLQRGSSSAGGNHRSIDISLAQIYVPALGYLQEYG